MTKKQKAIGATAVIAASIGASVLVTREHVEAQPRIVVERDTKTQKFSVSEVENGKTKVIATGIDADKADELISKKIGRHKKE